MMATKVACGLCLLALCLTVVSCKKLESTGPAGPLAAESTKFADAIPDEYGTLISVTQNPQTPGWFGLWFQKPDKTIVVTFVNVDQRRIYEKTLSIPRK